MDYTTPSAAATTAIKTAISLLPARIANKLSTLDNRTLRTIRGNRLARTNGDYNRHIRRHHIFLACTDLCIANTKAKRASLS